MGGAGVGKSALAQSISEKFQERQQLAASFFFFRADSSRNDGDRLIPTLVWQLIGSFKELGPFVEDSIRENLDVFTKIYQVQIQELLIKPLLALKAEGSAITPPRLIVIDGLDECENPEIQCDLLRVIARIIPHIPYPLRFFITSRPEAHIVDVFNLDDSLRAIPIPRYNLSDDPDADMDIRRFFEKEFTEIRRNHRLSLHLPPTWPDGDAIGSLVERSSGHFIYASTVISFIRSTRHRPDDRLEIILRLRPPRAGDKPYAQLDALFSLIFAGVEAQDLETICIFLAFLHFQSRGIGLFARFGPRISTIEDILEMRAGDLVLLLDPILSLIAIDGDNVRVLHKSLVDYLLDVARGGHLPFDLNQFHGLAANYILKHWIIPKTCGTFLFHTYSDSPPTFVKAQRTIQYFAYHCRYGRLDDRLKDYLRTLEVPYPESLIQTPVFFPPWKDDLNQFLRSTMWDFFRTLSREVGITLRLLWCEYLTLIS